jgi:CIC family chloride channel protein
MIDRANAAPGHSWIWWTILTPALGGLVAGLGLTYLAPAAAGSGIPQVKVAFSLRHGLITLRETIGKFVLCALQIGSGASLGLEGPTVQICAGVSSLLARAARLSPTKPPAHGLCGHGGRHRRCIQRAPSPRSPLRWKS